MALTAPDQPPYGALIESARDDAGLSLREAARRAGISDAWWRYIVRGYQKAPGDVPGPADTVARMARAVGLAPGRLESEGQRPDAAEILREILRTPPEPPAAGRPLTAVPPPPVLPDDPTDQQVAQFIIRQQDDELVMDLWRAWTFRPASREQRLEMVRELSRDPAEVLAEIEAEDRGEDRGGGRHREHREQALAEALGSGIASARALAHAMSRLHFDLVQSRHSGKLAITPRTSHITGDPQRTTANGTPARHEGHRAAPDATWHHRRPQRAIPRAGGARGGRRRGRATEHGHDSPGLAARAVPPGPQRRRAASRPDRRRQPGSRDRLRRRQRRRAPRRPGPPR